MIFQLRSSKRFYFLILIIGIILATAIFVFFFLNRKQSTPQEFDEKAIQFENQILDELAKNGNHLGTKERVMLDFETLQNPITSDKIRFESLIKIANTVADEYYETNVPFYRNFITKDLNNYAKEKFPKSYSPNLFIVLCADSTCGEPESSEIKEIINYVNKSKIDESTKNSILQNIKNMSFLSKENIDDKEFMAKFIDNQLNRYDDPDALQASSLLKNYFRQNYNITL